jgi:hypothetical protein
MRYQVTATFETDREMTQDELDCMLYAVRVQVEEPMTKYGDDEYQEIKSDLRTTSIKLDLNQVGE